VNHVPTLLRPCTRLFQTVFRLLISCVDAAKAAAGLPVENDNIDKKIDSEMPLYTV